MKEPYGQKARNDEGMDAAGGGFIWAGKESCMDEVTGPAHCVLLPCPEDSVNWDATRNLYIEGDNIEALKLLQGDFCGAVKMIYIDPPYNTGGGFVYNDDFSRRAGSPHHDWLCMMYPRLLLARKLLCDDGVIFLSINENELFHLKLLCDEVFGEAHYLTTFSVKVRHESRILKGDKDYHEVIEYLLLYRKSKAFTAPRQEVQGDLCAYVWRVQELCPAFETVMMGVKQVQVFYPDQYSIARQEPGQHLFKRINIRGALKEANSSGRFYMKYLDAVQEKGLLFKVPDIGDDGLGFRYFLTPVKEKRKNGDYFQGVPQHRTVRRIPYPNFLDFERAFNRVGFEGGVEFRNGKKPVAFLEKILEMAGLQREDGIVMDFFAGSASTAHAVMSTNARYSRNNRFIMVQLNEDLDVSVRSAANETQAAARKAIVFLDSIGRPHKLSELGKERLRRAGAQIQAEALKEGNSPPDTGFRVFRVGSKMTVDNISADPDL